MELLVNFIRHQDQIVLAAEAHDCLHVFEWEGVPRRIARVDHDEGARDHPSS